MNHKKILLIIMLVMIISCFRLAYGQAKQDSISNNKYGYIPASPADLQSFETPPRFRNFLPEAVDLSVKFPVPGDQGNLNSCVAWSVGYAARSYYASTVEKRPLSDPGNIPSPSYIYHSSRKPKDCQSGLTFPAAWKTLVRGSLSIRAYPYRTDCIVPSPALQATAVDFKIDDAMRIDHREIDNIKGQLATGHPVIFGMFVGAEFENLKGDQIYSGNATVNGHAMTAVGYDDSRQAIKLINSWGTDWGDKGYGWISYDAFEQNAREAYVLRVKPPTTPVPEKPDIEPRPRHEVAIVIDLEPKQTDDNSPDTPQKVEVDAGPLPARDEGENLVIENAVVTANDLVPPSSCSKLKIEKRDGLTVVAGFAETVSVLDATKAKLPTAVIDAVVRPWPQCEILMTLGERLGRSEAPKISIEDGVTALRNGDVLSFSVTTPDKPSFVYVSYIQADGTVVQLFQPTGNVPSPTSPSTMMKFGDGREGRARFTVSEPFGREMIVVVASESPLYDEPLPDQQIERDFLSQLRKALVYKADPDLPDRKVSAAYIGLQTRED